MFTRSVFGGITLNASPLFLMLARPSGLALGIAALAHRSATTYGCSETIELRLNGEPLANQQVTDYLDGSRSRYTTDADGRFEFPHGCLGMEYTDASGVGYRMLEFCGVSSDVPSINLILLRQ